MKRFFTTFIFALAIASVAIAAKKQIRVSTAEEFINAIGDNREIIVCNPEGILLTPVISEMLEAKKLKYFDYETRALQVGIFGDYETDGPQLVISGIKGLTITSETSDRCAIEVTPRYAYVLSFISCQDITFKNLLLGHTREGFCSNGVLGFDDCTNVRIENCGLYGCGTEGILARKTNNLFMTDSEIFECSYSILHLYGCNKCEFKNCYFYENKEYDLVGVDDGCTEILFNHCSFAGNKGTLFNFFDPSNVRLLNCLIQHDGIVYRNDEGTSLVNSVIL